MFQWKREGKPNVHIDNTLRINSWFLESNQFPWNLSGACLCRWQKKSWVFCEFPRNDKIIVNVSFLLTDFSNRVEKNFQVSDYESLILKLEEPVCLSVFNVVNSYPIYYVNHLLFSYCNIFFRCLYSFQLARTPTSWGCRLVSFEFSFVEYWASSSNPVVGDGILMRIDKYDHLVIKTQKDSRFKLESDDRGKASVIQKQIFNSYTCLISELLSQVKCWRQFSAWDERSILICGIFSSLDLILVCYYVLISWLSTIGMPEKESR